MERKVLKSIRGVRNMNIRWQTFKIIDVSLRCLSKDVIPTSVRLKSNIRTPMAKYIIRKVERALLNERIRSINKSITMFKSLRDTCINQLESILNKETMEKCRDFIEIRRERRHLSTLDWHLSKFKRSCHNYTGGCSSPLHGVHGKNGHTTDTCTATTTTATVDQITSTYTISDSWVRNLSKPPWLKPKNICWFTLFWYPRTHQPAST